MNSGGSIFKGFAGVYVFYQGIQLLIGLKNGNPAFSVPVTVLLIICFLGFGGYFLYGSVVDFKKEKEAKNENAVADSEVIEDITAEGEVVGVIAADDEAENSERTEDK